MVDINTAVRFLDDVIDGDPKTNDLCPGKIDGKNLRLLGVQTERRIFRKDTIKHVIFVQEGTENIWYKKNVCYPVVVKMGFSISEMKMDKRSVPMEVYANAFLRPDSFIPELDTTGREWLRRNDFSLL